MILYEMLSGRAPFAHKNKQKVLNDVLKAPMPPFKFSENANDLLRRLLIRDPKKRIGYGDKDAEEIMLHPFFEQIDWEKLAQRNATPPYIPKVKKQDDLRHIDPMFKEEKIEDTPADKKLRLSEKEMNHFNEFTYSKDTVINSMEIEQDDDGLSQIIEEREDSFVPTNSEQLELNI